MRVPKWGARGVMRILMVSQHYWPEPFNVSDICEALVERGHRVTVLTGMPNYPEGDIYSGYENGKNEFQQRNGVEIVRVSLVPRKHDPVHRVLNYYSFARNGERAQQTLPANFDAVVSFQTSPVMQARPAIAFAERTSVPLLHYVVDIWPECLLAGGVKKGSAVYKHYAKVSSGIYRKADRLAVTSPLFVDYLSNLLGRQVDAAFLPQYAEEGFFAPFAGSAPEGYDPSRFNVTFAGNVGAAQSVQTLVRAAALLKNDASFAFHVVGSGSELSVCVKLAEELGAGNVTFHGRHDIADMPAYYAASDAMAATFSSDEMLAWTLPRKVQSYMAAGRPIVAAIGGETERVVNDAQCGVCCGAEDAEGLADAVRRLAQLPCEQRIEMGACGREYCLANYTKRSFIDTLERELEQLKGTKHGM